MKCHTWMFQFLLWYHPFLQHYLSQIPKHYNNVSHRGGCWWWWGAVGGEWPCRRNVGVGFHTTADTQKPGGPSGSETQHRGGAPVKLCPGRRRLLRARKGPERRCRAGSQSCCCCGSIGAANRKPKAARNEIDRTFIVKKR